MRDPLHACRRLRAFGLVAIGAVLMAATPAIAAGKIIRPDAADRVDDRNATVAPAQTAPVEVAPVGQEVAVIGSKSVGSKTAVDPDAPEPLGERAQAALDRAKRALAEEEMGDAEAEPVPLVGQSVDPRAKSAAASKSAVKCLAGC